MSDSFFQKLHNIACGIQNDVQFITEALSMPKEAIPSVIGEQKLRQMEEELKSKSINYETEYYDMKNLLESASRFRQSMDEKLTEMEQKLNLSEERMAASGTYIPWRDASSKETLQIQSAPTAPFLSPDSMCNKQLCGVTPIDIATPKYQFVTPSSTVACASSTPFNHSQTHDPRQLSFAYNGGFSATHNVTVVEQDSKLKKLTTTPEEPVLTSRLFMQKSNIKSVCRSLHTDSSPEEPSLQSVCKSITGMSLASLDRNSTPKEPVLPSRQIMIKSNLASLDRNSTPEEPSLQSVCKSITGMSLASLDRDSTPEEPVLPSRQIMAKSNLASLDRNSTPEEPSRQITVKSNPA